MREVHPDGTFGPIYFIRYCQQHGWNEHNTNYPLYTASPDEGFKRACEALLTRSAEYARARKKRFQWQ